MIIAGIVTYNPDIERLSDNVNAILPQVEEVVIFDNASDNAAEIISTFKGQCTIIQSETNHNIGIASALNEICRYSVLHGYDWVITLDQDSICPGNIISEYKRFYLNSNIGMISPRVNDRNIGIINDHPITETDEVDFCITSASMLNLPVWKEIGGFWDDLFIDMVDFDICWTLKEHGYKILKVNSVILLHELGHSQKARFRKKELAVFNHSPKRYYYIFRNTIAVGKKHHRRIQCLRWNLKRLWIVLRYEDNRFNKLKAIALGFFDGVIKRYGEMTHELR